MIDLILVLLNLYKITIGCKPLFKTAQ